MTDSRFPASQADVSTEGHRVVREHLNAFTDRHAVRILLACESGSRAWGFASPDSDYDVRVVYVHDLDWYLSIDLERRPDAIDPEIVQTPAGEVDLHAWDVRKALRLFHASNPSLLEWLQSPIVYREDAGRMDRWRGLIAEVYRPAAAGYHHLYMARKNAKRYLDNEGGVPMKAYLYVLRSLLAIRWVESTNDPVPVRFARLVDAGVQDGRLRDAVARLTARKQQRGEAGRIERMPTLDAFIREELDRHSDARFASEEQRPDRDVLNRLFREIVTAGPGD
ncbi:nucleotidyltransferase domain-containing protein [Longibacter sp.]|uniref:nucleotidyltransferase domain-containing protein n=1 Tax=Longibacter sp. TaxID=2045415 RepID=UPI003EC098B5